MASTISCTTVNIGANPVIAIRVDATNSQVWRLTWSSGNQRGTIGKGYLVKGLIFNKTITDYTWSMSLYDLIPEDTSVNITLTLETFASDYDVDLVERVTYSARATVNASYSTPTVSVPRIVDTNALSVALTGDPTVLVRYVSTASVDVDIEARHSAYILPDKTTVTCGSATRNYLNDIVFENVESNVFKIVAHDSRWLITRVTYTVPDYNYIEYVRPTCVADSARPDTSGKARLMCHGTFFDDNFGVQDNTIAADYRYKEVDGEYSDWVAMSVSVNGNTYDATATLTGLDYRKTYVFEYRATDKATSVSTADDPISALPVFHWSKTDFVHETPVDFRAGIMVNGNESDVIVEQGTTGNWAYRKWESGRAECWGTFNRTLTSSDWSAWGSLYQATIINTILDSISYPFSFIEIPKEYATLQSGSGGMLNGSAFGMSASTPSSYFIVHPNNLTSGSYSCTLNLYVVGKWK